MFRFAGIDVFVHWSWFLVALYEINQRRDDYSSIVWNVLEYGALFVIVLLHEFGHALACRQTGGRADLIVLWPLGGAAYVAPPPRPGAQLWSLAAGPLVNLVLLPVAILLVVLSQQFGWGDSLPDAYHFLMAMAFINAGLLIFNLMPIYPLDGGQILRSILWFFLGPGRSLMAATIIGFIGVAGLLAFAVVNESVWLGIMAVFILFNCWRGWQQARLITKVTDAPRRDNFACPVCHTAPPIGAIWSCRCGARFDTFATGATCPQCHGQFPATTCPRCGAARPFVDWAQPSPQPSA